MAEYEERIVSIAKKELNTEEGGFGTIISAKNFVYLGNVIIITSSILSPYYKEKENQKDIDDIIKAFYKLDGFGSISMGYEINKIIDKVEVLLAKLKLKVKS